MFTKQLTQSLMAVVALVMITFASQKANATFFLTSSDIQGNDIVAGSLVGPPITDRNQYNATSKTYTNLYSVDGRVRTIVIGQMTTLEPSPPIISPLAGPVAETNLLSFIAVIDGKLGANDTVKYDSGRLGAFRISEGSFDKTKPSTWGFGSFAAPGSFAEWTLADPTNIGVDLGFGINLQDPIPASAVNTASADSLTPGVLTEGRFLFMEDSPDNGEIGDDFISILDNLNHNVNDPFSPTPNSGEISDPNTSISGKNQGEGVFIDSADTISQDLVGVSTDLANTALDLAILNEIGMWGTVDDLNPGGVAVDGGASAGFATAFAAASVNPTEFSPLFINNVSVSGDFTSTDGDLDVRPGVNVGVPEPTTAVLGLMGLAGIGLRRRRNA